MAAGQDVTLQCQADGYPKPNITWKKAVGTLNIFALTLLLSNVKENSLSSQFIIILQS